jgi:hypothetical protein
LRFLRVIAHIFVPVSRRSIPVFSLFFRNVAGCAESADPPEILVSNPEFPSYNLRWVAVHQQYGERGEVKPMNNSRHSDPAERSALMRLFYRDWRPTRLGLWVNRFSGWWSGLGLPPRFQAVIEVRGRTSGRRRSNPVVIATVEGKHYLVSMLGPGSD